METYIITVAKCCTSAKNTEVQFSKPFHRFFFKKQFKCAE